MRQLFVPRQWEGRIREAVKNHQKKEQLIEQSRSWREALEEDKEVEPVLTAYWSQLGRLHALDDRYGEVLERL